MLNEKNTITVNITTMAIIGCNNYERENPQILQIKLTIFDQKINNKLLLNKLKNIIKNYTQTKKPFLLEKMALDLAESLAKKHIANFLLTIEKPKALADALCSFVSIRKA
jgi:dihydroneopterin aldolase